MTQKKSCPWCDPRQGQRAYRTEYDRFRINNFESRYPKGTVINGKKVGGQFKKNRGRSWVLIPKNMCQDCTIRAIEYSNTYRDPRQLSECTPYCFNEDGECDDEFCIAL